jgi:hypothetical protein
VRASIWVSYFVAWVRYFFALPMVTVQARGEDGNRDKTGTTGGRQKERGLQGVVYSALTDRVSIYPERAGFEPAVRLPVHWFSKPAPSATRTPLQAEGTYTCTQHLAVREPRGR